MQKSAGGQDVIIKTKRHYPIQELFNLMKEKIGEKFGTIEMKKGGFGGQIIIVQGVDGYINKVSSIKKTIIIAQTKEEKRSVVGGILSHVTGGATSDIAANIKGVAAILKLDGSKGNRAVMEELAKDIENFVEVKTGGCYVATCIYGSYNCPEVWTLRRYRDNILSTSWFGRQFIRIYYTVSPKVVELFGNYKWFNRFWKPVFNRFIRKLQKSGIDSGFYLD